MRIQPLPMHPVHQHAEDLVLAVAERPVAAGLTVLRQQILQIDDWQITLAIVGESHVVTMTQAGTPRLQEILACVDVPPSRCLHHHALKDLMAYSYEQAGYRVAVTFDDVPTPPQANRAALQVAFPEVKGHAPLTRIQWAQDETSLCWWTLHTYPVEFGLTCVHTTSKIVFQDIQEGK